MISPLPVETPVSRGEEDVRQFMQEIRQYPLLTAEQERILAQRCVAGDEDAIRQMVNAHLRLVVSVAREYAGRGVPLLDLVQEGSIGLLAAAKKFDLSRECRFATYATMWIRQGITRYITNQSGQIRVPSYTADLLRRITFAQQELQKQLGRAPTAAETAEACQMPEEKVTGLLRLQPETCSLDAPVGESNAMSALLEDLQAPQPQEMLVRQALIETLEQLLSMLTQRQQQVLRLRFGLDDGVCCSLEQIGVRLGISKERVRQLEKQGIQKLQELGADMGLEDFL